MSGEQVEDDPVGEGAEGPTTTTSTIEQPAPSSTAESTGGDELRFDTDYIFPRNDRVFESQPEDRPVFFNWTLKDNDLELKTVSLIARNGIDGDFRLVRDFPFGPNGAPSINLFTEFNSTGVNVDFSLFVESAPNDEELRDRLATHDEHHILALRIDWKKDGSVGGYTVSPYFCVINGEDANLASTLQDELKLGGKPAVMGWELDENSDGTVGNENGSEGGGSGNDSNPSAGDGPDDTSDTDEGNSNDADDDGSSSSSGGGGRSLSTGAIAGISVGGAVFLIAVAVLLWFIIRKRRSKSKLRTPYSQTPELTNDYIAGKDGNDLNSPYSEDGGPTTQRTPLEPNTIRSNADSRASFTPYQDNHRSSTQDNHQGASLVRSNTSNSISTGSYTVENTSPTTQEGRNAAMDSNRVSQQTRQNVSQSVAHLVEDGMTEDDIRRLEEEERQLDFEIERAGRR